MNHQNATMALRRTETLRAPLLVLIVSSLPAAAASASAARSWLLLKKLVNPTVRIHQKNPVGGEMPPGSTGRGLVIVEANDIPEPDVSQIAAEAGVPATPL
jgi:hypothetical protein